MHMPATLVAFIVLACTFGGALFGMLLRRILPENHLGTDSKETVQLTMGLVGSMTALVLGLVTASAKTSYDEVDAAVKQTAVNLLSLDRVLARYGPDAGDLRNVLKRAVEGRVDQIWPEGRAGVERNDVRLLAPSGSSEGLADRIAMLTPNNDVQRALQSRAVELAERLLEQRWLVVSQTQAPVPTAFLVILVFWLTAAFGSYGLFAPSNGTVTGALFLGSLSVAAALFLVLELGTPFEGGVKVSGDPMRRAIDLMAK
jgi:Protein of unknown function (DUF4239)